MSRSASYQEFFRVVVTRDGYRCIRKGTLGHVCSGPLDAHHCLKRQWLERLHNRSPEERQRLAWDPRNGVMACRNEAHRDLDSADPLRMLQEHEISEPLREFVAENDLHFLLERAVPGVRV